MGDILNLLPGMEIPADCLVLSSSHLTVDESLISSSNNIVKKANLTESLIKQSRSSIDSENIFDLPTPVLLSGSKVITGEAKVLVAVVGKNTILYGQKTVIRENFPKETPLQKDLKVLAHTIGKIAFQSSLVIVFVFLMRFLAERSGDSSWDNQKHWKQLFNCFFIGVFK